MQLGHTADEIKYDVTYGSTARYVVLLDGQPTMHILCDSTAPEKTIRIASVNGGVVLDTLGRFTMAAELLEDADGMPLGTSEQVDAKSVYLYVIPRLHILLGRLLRAYAPLP